jgi:hypothetical protein
MRDLIVLAKYAICSCQRVKIIAIFCSVPKSLTVSVNYRIVPKTAIARPHAT